jgi:hypothetical protein
VHKSLDGGCLHSRGAGGQAGQVQDVLPLLQYQPPKPRQTLPDGAWQPVAWQARGLEPRDYFFQNLGRGPRLHFEVAQPALTGKGQDSKRNRKSDAGSPRPPG